MNRARIDYSQKISGDNIAKAKANELNMSPKHSIEIATFIRHQRVNDAIAYLNDVVGLKKAIPFRRFNRNVAHKRGLPGNWDAGRYPVKASKAYIRVLESVKKNAEYTSLQVEKWNVMSELLGIDARADELRRDGQPAPYEEGFEFLPAEKRRRLREKTEALVSRDIEKWTKLIRAAGIRAD